MDDVLTVRRAGLAAVQDLGRRGLEGRGIPVNGAADQYSARVANTLVGNPADRPLIEITATEFAVEGSRPLLVSVTGATADIAVGGRPARQWEPLVIPPRVPVEIGRPRNGLRVYLAVNGVLDAGRVLGSCAPDSLLGVDTALRTASTIGVTSAFTTLDHPEFRHPVFRLAAAVPRYGSPWTIDVAPGPDAGEFEDALQTLCAGEYRTSPRSDHIGLRLGGPVPRRTLTEEVLSRGVPIGAIEVPPSSGLLLLLRGRPVTAGYPVVAVAGRAAQPSLGQIAPGHAVRFRARSLEELTRAARAQWRLVDELSRRVRAAFGALGIPASLELEGAPH